MRLPIKAGFLAATLLSACAACQGGGKPPAAQADPVGPSWTLVRLGGETLQLLPGTRPIGFTLVAQGNRVQGDTGCNRMTGGYTLQGDRLGFGQVATTRMACADPEVSRWEMGFLKALDATARWEIRGGSLELLDSLGKPLARLESPSPR
ncbi:Heat shock protein HslJ [Methylomagnum ishizawai]|uniref:Heat shock protein HslJ n=1 Tax=Methylomagnum ishizawai TaxID=1760988 RepID=A0A1Y6D085_9GAMM|nr:META domain-containing protein [Methylomagnum ishizawai]SMF95860.1 Heat shock protein HslJ [Methylomagnum ishizawai]